MRNLPRVMFALAVLMTMPCTSIGGGGPPATRPSRERIINSIKGISHFRRGFTNVAKSADERTDALKSATVESLQKPTVISSVYWPQSRKDGSVWTLIIWIEDKPSLKEVI